MPKAVDREQLNKRRELAWEMHSKGKTPSQIAKAIEDAGLGKMTRQAVHNMVGSLEDQTFRALKEERKNEKMRQLFRLNRLFNEAWTAYEESKKPATEVTTRQGQGGPVGEPVVKTKRNPAGDPRFLAEARQCEADIRKLLGLDEATRLTVGIEIDEEEQQQRDAVREKFKDWNVVELRLFTLLGEMQEAVVEKVARRVAGDDDAKLIVPEGEVLDVFCEFTGVNRWGEGLRSLVESAKTPGPSAVVPAAVAAPQPAAVTAPAAPVPVVPVVPQPLGPEPAAKPAEMTIEEMMTCDQDAKKPGSPGFVNVQRRDPEEMLRRTGLLE